MIIGGTCTANGGGSTTTFNQVYSNGAGASDETATLTSGKGGLVVQDAVSPIGANLFTVQSNGGSTKFFNVTSSGVAITGTVTASSNINTTGGQFQVNGIQISSANLSNDSNLAKLSANQTFSAATILFSSASNSFYWRWYGLIQCQCRPA